MQSNNKSRYYEHFGEDYGIKLKDGQFPPSNHFHIHDEFELTFIINGNISCTIGDQKHIVGSNSLLLFNNMDLHKTACLDDSEFIRYVLWFRPEYIEGLSSSQTDLLECYFCRPCESPQILFLKDDDAQKLTILLDKLLQLSTSKAVYGQELLVRFALAESLILANKAYRNKYHIISDTIHPEYSLVYSAILYVHKNLDESLYVDELAKTFYLSSRKFTQLFQAVTGQTPYKYILHCRIQKAKSLLQKNVSVDEVCAASGFNNLSNFSRTFKNYVGYNPKKYAQQIKNQDSL